jgi:hypothetical protein
VIAASEDHCLSGPSDMKIFAKNCRTVRSLTQAGDGGTNLADVARSLYLCTIVERLVD